jgi:uracil-DNA glycosylase
MKNLRAFAVLGLVAAMASLGCAADAPEEESDVSDDALKTCEPLDGPSDPDAATRLWAEVPSTWHAVLGLERRRVYFPRLATFVAGARAGEKAVFPTEEDTFTALKLARPEAVQVVILGQDPYIQTGQAHGLAFSVKPPTAPPPSLRNIFKELASDIPGITPVSHGSLEAWAAQGVLMLNAVLTVEEGKPGSHACQGWETFTDAIIRTLSARKDKVVFVLWGSFAQSKIPLIDAHHVIITGAHPSPKSADRGFFGSRPFSKVNASLKEQGKPTINWQLPNL